MNIKYRNIFIRAVITLILTITSISPVYAMSLPEERTGYIFIGDSRFVGMDKVCAISQDEDKFVIAKVGEGYDYLKNTAEFKAENIIASHPEFTNWKYIICLGVNDLGNIKKYQDEFGKIASNHDLTLVSVNPVAYHKTITNTAISTFNSNICNIAGAKYIDSYSVLVNNGFMTADGVHYTKETYQDIYNIIRMAI